MSAPDDRFPTPIALSFACALAISVAPVSAQIVPQYSTPYVAVGNAVEHMYDLQQQYQEAGNYTANARAQWIADQQYKAAYLQQQNQQRQQYEAFMLRQQQQQAIQQQYRVANSTAMYAPPPQPISSAQQSYYVNQWNQQYLSRQAQMTQWGLSPISSPYYAPPQQSAQRRCTNGQYTWPC